MVQTPIPLLNKTFTKSELEVLQLLQFPAWIMDCENMKCIWGNEAARLIWDVDCILSVDWSEASIQSRQRLKNKLTTLLSSGLNSTWEIWNMYPKGIPTKFKCNYSPIKIALDNSNPEQYYLLMYCNIEGVENTKNHFAYEILNYSEKHFTMYSVEGEKLFTNAAAETRRRFENCNLQFYDHFPEIEREQRIAKLFDKFNSLGWGDSIDNFIINRDFSTDTLKQFSVNQTITKNDEEKWWRVNVKKVRDVGSGNPAILVEEEDITELKSIQKQLEIADSAKTSFLANMSHELRTPVSGIIGILDYLLHWSDLTCDQLSCIQTAQNSGECLLILLNDILDFSKISAGQLSIVGDPFTVVDTVNLVESVCELLSFNVKENVVLYSEFNPLLFNSSLKFSLDSSRIRQILINLVGNAIKFTLSGSIKVELDFVLQPTRNIRNSSTIPNFDSEYHLQILVTDSGIGINPEKIETIFEAFVQADSSTTRKFGGTGLGLSISRRLANLMNGDVFVSRSEEGVGSTFAFYIPTGVNEKEVKLIDEISSKTTLPVSNASIVVLEENKDMIVDLLKNYFTRFNIPVDVLYNIEDLRDSPKHVIFVITNNSIAESSLDELYDFKLKYEDNSHFFIITPFKKEPTNECLLKLADNILPLPIKISQLHSKVKDLNFAEKQRERIRLQMRTLSEPIINRLIERGGCNVLLADDNSINRLIIIKFLKELGIVPLVARNGREAVNIYKENLNNIDLILTDLNMPELSGTQVTTLIREEEANWMKSTGIHNHVIIVGITAEETAKDICLQSGMDSFLSKPVRFCQIANLIETWIK